MLWRDDLVPSRTAVVLSSEDNIVPVEEVSQYLRRRSLRPGRKGRVASLTVLDGARHGGFLSASYRDQTLAVVRRAQRWGARKGASSASSRAAAATGGQPSPSRARLRLASRALYLPRGALHVLRGSVSGATRLLLAPRRADTTHASRRGLVLASGAEEPAADGQLPS